MDREALLTEADRCVKCGLCLPHCPTYRISRDEGDSPRGRIALLQGLAQGQVDTPQLHRHLDRCLGCLACERACPSGVNYGKLIDGARTLQAQLGHEKTPRSFGLHLLSRLPYLRMTAGGLRLYQKSGLRTIARKIGGKRFRRLDALLPGSIAARPTTHTTSAASAGRIALFSGCIGGITDRPALLAARELLVRLGFDVVVPPRQGCCGALHQHNGHPAQATQLAARNRRVFNAESVDAILFVASGCGIQLQEYENLGQAFTAPLMEACAFIAQQAGIDGLPFQPLDRPVLLHTPCSAQGLAGRGEAAAGLLRFIPGLEIRTPQDTGCCGAAGSYLLFQPDWADRLREPLLAEAAERPLHALVTSNTGCALHLAAGLRGSAQQLPVLHPLQLLRQQLRD